MAKRKPAKSRKPARRAAPARRGPKRAPKRRAVKRASRKRPPVRRASAPKKKTAKKTGRKASSPPKTATAPPTRVPRLERARRTLDETVPTPPSSLNMDRRGSAVRTGRAEIAEHLRERHGMSAVSAGDPDVDTEDAFFTGDQAP